MSRVYSSFGPVLVPRCLSMVTGLAPVCSRLPQTFRQLCSRQRVINQLYPLIQEFSVVLVTFPMEKDNHRISMAYKNSCSPFVLYDACILAVGLTHIYTKIQNEGNAPSWEMPCSWERKSSVWTWHTATALLILSAQASHGEGKCSPLVQT